jgi:hypothetical protein
VRVAEAGSASHPSAGIPAAQIQRVRGVFQIPSWQRQPLQTPRLLSSPVGSRVGLTSVIGQFASSWWAPSSTAALNSVTAWSMSPVSPSFSPAGDPVIDQRLAIGLVEREEPVLGRLRKLSATRREGRGQRSVAPIGAALLRCRR